MSDEQDKKDRRDAKKERVLHTRVPAVLEQELKRLANAWRVPVSNVVRAMLEDALDTIDEVGRKAMPESIERRPEPSEGDDPLAGAVGMTPIKLVHDATCGVTGKALPAGSDALMILFAEPGKQLIAGKDAVPNQANPNKEESND